MSRMKPLPLVDVTEGLVRVKALEGTQTQQQRLNDLGLHVGARVEIIKHNGSAGILIGVNEDTRIMLDHDTASMISVVRIGPPAPTIPVSELRPGDEVRIAGFNHGAADYRQRLLSMGLTPGATFAVTRVAPLGDPIEIKVRGFAMSLRKTEAEMLIVEKI